MKTRNNYGNLNEPRNRMGEYERGIRDINNRRRRRRRARSFALTMVFILLLIIVGFGGFLTYYVMHYNSVNGKWVTKLDYTDEMVAKVALWMSDVKGADIDIDFVKSYADDMTIDVIMELNKEDLTSGTYKVYVDESSYKDFAGKAQKLQASCLEAVITDKLVESGYKDNMTAEETGALVSQILSCSMEEYLINNELTIMPSFEDVNGQVVSDGTYKLNMDTITRSSSAGLVKEKYTVDDGVLVLLEQGIIYRKQVENE